MKSAVLALNCVIAFELFLLRSSAHGIFTLIVGSNMGLSLCSADWRSWVLSRA